MKRQKATVADPDLQIRGGPGLQKNFFFALRASVWSKNKGGGGGGGSPGPLPWIRHWANSIKNLTGQFVHTEPFNTFAVFTRN